MNCLSRFYSCAAINISSQILFHSPRTRFRSEAEISGNVDTSPSTRSFVVRNEARTNLLRWWKKRWEMVCGSDVFWRCLTKLETNFRNQINGSLERTQTRKHVRNNEKIHLNSSMNEKCQNTTRSFETSSGGAKARKSLVGNLKLPLSDDEPIVTLKLSRTMKTFHSLTSLIIEIRRFKWTLKLESCILRHDMIVPTRRRAILCSSKSRRKKNFESR